MSQSAQPVTISYNSLLEDDLSPVYDDILKGFGSEPDCLGLIIVKDLPDHYGQLRERALRVSARFAALPEAVQERYTDPESSYSFGWSHGKEIMNGVPDTLKGSFYANPTSDTQEATEELIKEHPSYLRSNVWPTDTDCPSFEKDVKALARFMTETGCLLAKACDKLVAQHSEIASVEKMIRSSRCSKARLLHYFPPPGQTVSVKALSNDVKAASSSNADSWCGDHLDHSLLTALCPAIYLFHPTGQESVEPLAVPAPTASAGLFIRTRAGKELQARIPANCMAFQTGEALQLLTRNQLQATPHYVAAGTDGAILPVVTETLQKKVQDDPSWNEVQQGVISRETMAVFLQPDVDAVIGTDGETFGQFTKRILAGHYEGQAL